MMSIDSLVESNDYHQSHKNVNRTLTAVHAVTGCGVFLLIIQKVISTIPHVTSLGPVIGSSLLCESTWRSPGIIQSMPKCIQKIFERPPRSGKNERERNTSGVEAGRSS